MEKVKLQTGQVGRYFNTFIFEHNIYIDGNTDSKYTKHLILENEIYHNICYMSL